jgi:superfamily II DNA or RNA helicase
LNARAKHPANGNRTESNMAHLEQLKNGSTVKGILPGAAVSILNAKWYGTETVELTYKDFQGNLGNELVTRERAAAFEIVEAGSLWSFTADAGLLRLASEAYRIRLAHLFDPLLAVHTSLVEPLPHQISAVYEEMVTRQPLRFLLADDPGAGKTIMAGLLIKELKLRGDLQRCLIVCPGTLAEQWQDELWRKFHLPFEIATNDSLEAARTGNWFGEHDLVIARLDKLSRNDELKAKLQTTDWDLIVCDEAHKMSASFFGGEVSYTKRYRLGQLLGEITRHFLFMTATPHNGKETDFQLFMALLDGDRFEGRFRDGVHTQKTDDLMRRLIKEKLVKFDGTPLFPERRAYTVNYTLSQAEAELYREVTDYVREEFNRADAVGNEGRRGTVGFALTILQRRLASSPEAIYQSLKRRRERLQNRLREELLRQRGARPHFADEKLADFEENIEDFDSDVPEMDVEEAEEFIVDQATAARTIEELEAEIETLTRLENLAAAVRRSGTDRKWEQLSSLLQNNAEIVDPNGQRRKLVIFTEHRDTLNYLADRVRGLLGRDEAVVTIHGGVGRDERRKMQEAFTQNKDVQILVATDAAGEGINLQRAHLMVNYDLPWNPNRLEQRFGRIHRIGQTEVCHLWNLVASETREGAVFDALCKKLEEESKALRGQIFDVLGKAFTDTPLRQLLLEAIRYGDQPEVRARLTRAVDEKLDRKHLRELLDEKALAEDTMDTTKVQHIRREMERAEARRLQPHFISSFFLDAFRHLGGKIYQRENRRYEITFVPQAVRSRDRLIGRGEAVLDKYERVCFEKELINAAGKPMASFICPGHPLLDATLDLILERYRDLLKQGAVLIDESDSGENARVLFYLDHTIRDGSLNKDGTRRVMSRRMQFVEIDETGQARTAGFAPYLDYRPLAEDEKPFLQELLAADWLKQDLENLATGYAIENLVAEHLTELRGRKEKLLARTEAAVKDRLTKEIAYWDHRAEDLRLQEQAGKTPKLNSAMARRRADELQQRLEKRMAELAAEKILSPSPPLIIGGALVVPIGLLNKRKGENGLSTFARNTKESEIKAMRAVMEIERTLGNSPMDVSRQKIGYDIESRARETERLRFIEVKGRAIGAETVIITRNEILTALNSPDEFILALAEIDGDNVRVRYVRNPFQKEPDFHATDVIYDFNELWEKGFEPNGAIL